MTKKIIYQPLNYQIKQKITDLISCKFEQAALGTVDPNGFPLVTKILPITKNSTLYLLISDLSEHTKNIASNPNVSIYFAGKEIRKSKLNNERLTLQGLLKKIDVIKTDSFFLALLECYVAIEPSASVWAYFSDFNFYEFEQQRLLYIEGFGQAFEHKTDTKSIDRDP